MAVTQYQSAFKFVNWITGVPWALEEGLSNINARGYPALYAGSTLYGVDPNNTALDNTIAINAAITAAGALSVLSPMGGAIVVLPHGKLLFNNWNLINYDNLYIVGQGRFSGGTECCFQEATGDNIVFSTAGHMGISDVYITAGVQRTGGYAIKITGGTFESEIRRVRIDLGWNGIWLDNSTNCTFHSVTFRYMFGTDGILIYGGSGSVFGWFIDRLDADNPYVYGYGTVKTWTVATGFTQGDIILNNGNIYQCSTTGTSAAAGTGPSGIPAVGLSAFSTPIVDNTAQWYYVANGAMIWLIMDSFAYSGCVTNSALISAFQGFAMRDQANTGSSYPTWMNCFNLQCDHNYSHNVVLTNGYGFYASGCWWGSSLQRRCLQIDTTFLGDVHVGEGTRMVGAWFDGVLINGGTQIRIHSCAIAQNSQRGAGLSHGINVAAGITDFVITDNAIGTGPAGSGVQGYGVLVNAGASDRYIITNNLVSGNTIAGVNDGGAGVNKNVSNNY